MERLVLLNPGPVTLSPRVRAALGAGDWCHREPEFAALTRDILGGIEAVYPDLPGGYEAALLTGSGTAAVEAMLASFAPRERRTLVLANGVYGERMARMLEAHGKPAHVLAFPWTAPIDLAEVDRCLGEMPGLSHVAVVHHETTTGRLNDLAALGRVCAARGARLLVDAVSSYGAEEIRAAEWNIAALAATANKCLHGVPGLSFVVADRELWRTVPERLGSVYLDLYAYHRAQRADGYSPFTQAVQVAFALREALAEHAEQGGWCARRALYRDRASRVHEALGRAGVVPLLRPEEYSCVLWSWRLPAGRTYAGLHDRLRRAGYVIYAGQGALAADIFRIAHMGDITPAELDRLCALLAG